MSNYSNGHKAERYAEKYLRKQGFKIIDRNWRTRFCEIDIIAMRKRQLYFIEVKYRRTASQGAGFDYITKTKLEQMIFAAEMWVNEKEWDKSYVLGAIEVSGSNYEVTGFLSSLD